MLDCLAACIPPVQAARPRHSCCPDSGKRAGPHSSGSRRPPTRAQLPAGPPRAETRPLGFCRAVLDCWSRPNVAGPTAFPLTNALRPSRPRAVACPRHHTAALMGNQGAARGALRARTWCRARGARGTLNPQASMTDTFPYTNAILIPSTSFFPSPFKELRHHNAPGLQQTRGGSTSALINSVRRLTPP